MSLAELTLHDAAAKLRNREFTAVELTEAVFQRIAETEPRVCAYLTLARDKALEDAARADETCDEPCADGPARDGYRSGWSRCRCARASPAPRVSLRRPEADG